MGLLPTDKFVWFILLSEEATVYSLKSNTIFLVPHAVKVSISRITQLEVVQDKIAIWALSIEPTIMSRVPSAACRKIHRFFTCNIGIHAQFGRKSIEKLPS